MNAFLVPGQGAKSDGLALPSFSEQEFWYSRLEQIVGAKIAPTNIGQHDINSVALVATGIAFFERAKTQGKSFGLTAGFSVGQFAALVAAGVADADQILQLVWERAQLMRGLSGHGLGMANIVGAALADLESLLAEIVSRAGKGFLEITNFNSPGNFTVGGSLDLLEELKLIAPGRGVKRVLALPLEGAWHSSAMKPLAEQYRSMLSKLKLRAPDLIFLCNVSGREERDPERIRENLVQHLYSAVRWDQEMSEMIRQGVTEAWVGGFGNDLQTMFFFKSRDVLVRQIGIGEA